MKKMLLVLSLVAAATAYSATNQLLNASLIVVDPATDIAINVTSTSLRFGDVGIVKGGSATSNDITIKVTGNNVKVAEVSFPDRGELTLKGGTEKLPIRYLAKNPVDGTVATSGGKHMITSAGNLGDGTTGKAMAVDIAANMTLTGAEKSGLYDGTVQIDAKYN